MKERKVVLLSILGALLVAILVFGTVQAADDYVLTIVNKSGHDMLFLIKDNIDDNPDEVKTVEVIIPGGESDDIKLNKGTYWVFYELCGDELDNKIKLTKDFEMVIYPCENQPTKMRISNHFDDTITIKFDGYDEYEFDVDFGKNKVELFSGNYDYTYEACGGEIFGEIWVTKDGTTDLILHSCEWYDDPARIHGPLNPVKYKLVNHASFPLILTLIGPENYLVTADPGVNIVRLVAGSYKFSYYLDFQTHTGSMFVPKNGNGSLILRPAYVIDNGLSGAE